MKKTQKHEHFVSKEENKTIELKKKKKNHSYNVISENKIKKGVHRTRVPATKQYR